jgi:hypothetical protein
MATTEIAWLRESIGTLLIPELEKRGFRAVPLTPEETRSEIEAAFPYGRLCRAGPTGMEIVEVQFDKNGRAAFRLNLGIVPPTGLQHAVAGFVPKENVWVHFLDHYYVLTERSLFNRWFSPSRSLTGTATRPDTETLVKRVVGLLDEVEVLFRDGRHGPHVREVKAT